MPYLVDGDNLLGTWPGRERSEGERRRLAMDLARLGRRWRRRIVTVFDGRPPQAGSFGADVRFSGGGRAADDVILALLRGEREPRGWVVVTSDRTLGDRCRHLGARVERCDRFRGRMLAAPRPDKPAEEEVQDLAYWLERFDEPDAG